MASHDNVNCCFGFIRSQLVQIGPSEMGQQRAGARFLNSELERVRFNFSLFDLILNSRLLSIGQCQKLHWCLTDNEIGNSGNGLHSSSLLKSITYGKRYWFAVKIKSGSNSDESCSKAANQVLTIRQTRRKPLSRSLIYQGKTNKEVPHFSGIYLLFPLCLAMPIEERNGMI